MPTYLPASLIPESHVIRKAMQKDINDMKTIHDKLKFLKHSIYSANTLFEGGTPEKILLYKNTVLTMAEIGMDKPVEGE